MAKSKHKATPEEIANDPSLKWCGYQWGECVVSDTLGDVRFIRYEADGIRVATISGIKELPDLVSPLQIRRHTLRPTENLTTEERQQALAEIVAKKMLVRQK